MKKKKLIDNWDLLLFITIIGIPFMMFRIANKWEYNNEVDERAVEEIDEEIKQLKKEIEGQYSDEENLKRWA